MPRDQRRSAGIKLDALILRRERPLVSSYSLSVNDENQNAPPEIRTHLAPKGRTIMLRVARYRDLMVATLSGEHKDDARRGAEVRFRDMSAARGQAV